MLVPAGILVLLILAAIAVDSSIVLLAQRDLANRTAATANDVAGALVDDSRFYSTGDIAVDERRASQYTALAFQPGRHPAGVETWRASATVVGRQVTIEASAEVPYLFGRAVPGLPRTTTVRARSTATATGGPP